MRVSRGSVAVSMATLSSGSHWRHVGGSCVRAGNPRMIR